MTCFCFFFYKQKTAYEMRISDWSSDVCSSDLFGAYRNGHFRRRRWSRRPANGGMVAQGRIGLMPDGGDDGNGAFGHRPHHDFQIGRASCRERVCQYVYISVVADSLKKKKTAKETRNSSRTQKIVDQMIA